MRFFVLLFVVLVAAWSGSARAMPADDSIRRQQATSDEDVEDDLVADGDIDGEDRIALRQRGREGVARLADQSWVSLAGLERSLQSGKTDLAAILVVGIAFDRIATGQVHRIGEPPKQSAASARAPKSEEAGALSPTLAHDCVAAAYRSAGLGVDDARVDAMIARERASALLPETRVRAMRLWNDADHTTTLGTTDSTNYYDAVAANLVLEVRLTWRLDLHLRLLRRQRRRRNVGSGNCDHSCVGRQIPCWI